MVEWQVALIAAGAAILGAATSSGTQLLMFQRQRADAREDDRRDGKAGVYSELLHVVGRLPHLHLDAAIAGDGEGHQLLQQMKRDVDRLQIDLLLVAHTAVRAEAATIPTAITRYAEEVNRLLNEDAQKSRDEQVGIDIVNYTAFESAVLPALERLADAMSKDLDSR